MSVIVYSTSTCPYCDMAKKFLSERGVSFNDINVEKDPIAARDMVAKSGQMGVPVIDFNGTIVLGFDRAKLESLI